MSAFPRVYRSFNEFERDELRKLDSLHTTVDDMLEENFSDDIEMFDGDVPKRKRGRPRKNP